MAESQTKRARRAKGLFPSIPLKNILEIPKKIFELGHGDPVRKATVFDGLGRSPDSGSSKQLIASARTGGYGLIEIDNRDMRLTDRGRAIVDAPDKISRYDAIYDALFSNEIFASFIDHFGNQNRLFPDDSIAIAHLVRTQHLSDKDAEKCWGVFKGDILDFDLTQLLSGKQRVITREMALDEIRKALPSAEDESADDVSEPLESADSSALTEKPEAFKASSLSLARTVKSSPEFHFNIQIQIPDNASAETYDSIFKSIATHLLGRDEDNE